MNVYVVGFFVSMLVGLATLGAFRWVIKHARFEFFAWYAWIVGFACLIWAWR
jgi:undecaprenyl pyrophosphate phosphatase UppP